EWDGWPNGDFSCLFSLDFVEAHDNLRVHWACETLGGSGNGSVQAETWQEGKVTRRKCRGIIECTSSTCAIIVRPQTRARGIQKQLSEACACGQPLLHQPCDVTSILHTFRDGVFYQNGGYHHHSRPTVRLHMSRKEKDQFTKIVQGNPGAGPLKLLVGQPGIEGPGDSVADITPLLLNSERIKYERRKILKDARAAAGANFAEEFTAFKEKYPNFICDAQFGDVTVIVMQTPFMAAKLVKSSVDREAVNGIVSDAAHRVWMDYNSLLIVSSTFEPTRLRCWVPGLMSYSNGGTAEHYRIHFFYLFRGMARECAARDIEVADELFANVVDFSAAQRKGFILAFVDFWVEHAPGERTIAELLDAAPKLIKGCAHHFRSQITRVKKISGVVDPSKTDIFENFARKLLSCKSIPEFNRHATEFIEAFPRAESWIRWWMLPAHACMLFPTFRVMTAELWDSIPETTNAEEAMHWKLYAAIGRRLPLLPGLKALFKFAEHYQRLFDATLTTHEDGVKIYYGPDPQRWKRVAARLGYTKYSRHRTRKVSKSDGRPPDTGKALLGKQAKARANGKVTAKSTKALEYEKSYRKSMQPMFNDLPSNHALRDLRQMVFTRVEVVTLAGYEPGGCTLLSQQRDGFRQSLVNMPRLKLTMQDFASMFGWLYHIIDIRGPQLTPGLERAISYFRTTSVILKSCKGSPENHWQLSKIKPRHEYQLHTELCEEYSGDLRKWFQDLVRVSKPSDLAACWHAQDGHVFCEGSAVQHEVILNLPVTLIIEIGDMRASNWSIPGILSPYASNPAASAVGLKYSIVGHVYCHMGDKHFIARYLTVTGLKKKIFDYDGMKHEGHAVRNRTTKMRGALTGPSHSLEGIPKGYLLYAVVYHLDGGETAQKFFRREQVTQAAKLGLTF
ncbi:hypothetical protein B0H16DRAFT_1254115, partial [Mycena metata]